MHAVDLQRLTSPILFVFFAHTVYFLIQTLQGTLLSCSYAVLDYAQTGLIAAVFFFKVSMLHLL